MRRSFPLTAWLLACGLFFAGTAPAAPGVVSVSPVPQSRSAGVFPDITVEFDTTMDVSTIHAGTIMISGRWSGVRPGTFSLEDGDRLLRFVPSLAFSAGEWVTVALSRGVRSAGGDSLQKGYSWNFWIASGAGTLDQTELERMAVRQPGEGHIQTYGANAADLNEDGYTDMTLCSRAHAVG